ncbi:DinB family protein [Thermobifida halotolerans]|uniref:DinB family protein n=1 Tax=Thermobifida halotolerans TaxID=483545 RepID=A0A399G9F5_9ACTN|nr:DinB family protein [Thermobifida halotolerans]UOE21150.1 DinB family protein [Thermobifida halotolerans]
MPVSRVDLLLHRLGTAWALLEHHLDGLDDPVCLWEPAPHCWTVRPDERGRWAADWQVPAPDPVPTATIGWLTWHIGFWWTTPGHCLGSGAPEREEITWPGSAEAAVEWLHGLKDGWRAHLVTLTDADLDSTDRTATLPGGREQTLAEVAGRVNIELTKNVAEIGPVRNLYGARG